MKTVVPTWMSVWFFVTAVPACCNVHPVPISRAPERQVPVLSVVWRPVGELPEKPSWVQVHAGTSGSFVALGAVRVDELLKPLLIRTIDAGKSWAFQILPLTLRDKYDVRIVSRTGPLKVLAGNHLLREDEGGWRVERILTSSKHSIVISGSSWDNATSVLVFNYDECCRTPKTNPPFDVGGRTSLVSSTGGQLPWEHVELPEECRTNTRSVGPVLDLRESNAAIVCNVFRRQDPIRHVLYRLPENGPAQQLYRSQRAIRAIQMLPNGEVLGAPATSPRQVCRYGSPIPVCTNLKAGFAAVSVDVSTDGTARVSAGKELLLMDGGGGWNVIYQHTSEIEAISFGSKTSGIMLANDGLFVTDNGGGSWAWLTEFKGN